MTKHPLICLVISKKGEFGLDSYLGLNEQDIFIQGLIDVHQIKRRQPSRINSAAFKYNVLFNNERHEVSVSEKRVKRIRQLSLAGKSPQDMRGKHPWPRRLSD